MIRADKKWLFACVFLASFSSAAAPIHDLVRSDDAPGLTSYLNAHPESINDKDNGETALVLAQRLKKDAFVNILVGAIARKIASLDATNTLPKGLEGQQLYITSNEMDVQRTIDALRSQLESHGKCNIGVSSVFNFSIASVTDPRLLIMIEINRNMVAINRELIELLKVAPNPQQFAEVFANSLMEKEDFFYSKHCIGAFECGQRKWQYVEHNFPLNIDFETFKPARDAQTDENFVDFVKRAFTGKYSPFEDPTAFHRMQRMAKEGRIVAIGLDLADTAHIKQIAEVIHQAGMKFGTIYASNVYEYLMSKAPEKKKNFRESINLMASPDTLIIDGLSHKYTTEHISDVHQNIFYQKDPKSGNNYDPDLARNLLPDGKFAPDESLRRSRYPSAPLLIEMPKDAYNKK